MSTINVTLGRDGIAELRARLSRLYTTCLFINEEVSGRVADRGAEFLADAIPRHAVDGNLPGGVKVEKGPAGARVSFVGDDVAYIEFGTGYVGQNAPYRDKEVLAKAGWEYDVNRHGEAGWWYPLNKDPSATSLEFAHSVGIAPMAPVLHASLAAKASINKIVAEVLDEKSRE